MELILDCVAKRYKNTWGLRPITVEFTPGVYGLLGPNGAGKSTLMKLITQNLQPSSGKILYNGENIQNMGENYRKDIGYVPQQQGLYEGFTGRRFLRYIASLKELSRKETEVQIDRLSHLVNMQDYLDKRMSAYSGGMKQRILIAQALLGDPKILILDEPTAGLDPKERIRIRSMIAEIAYDRIVIYATHVVSDIEYIAKELILMDKGRLLQKNTPSELLKSMKEQVWNVYCNRDQMEEIQNEFLVANIQECSDGKICVRVLAQCRPEGWNSEVAQPTLEDVYLNTFGE